MERARRGVCIARPAARSRGWGGRARAGHKQVRYRPRREGVARAGDDWQHRRRVGVRMSAVWLMAAVAAVWFARRKRKPAWNVMHIRDSHGCYLTVITDRDGSHFGWTSDSARAMVTADPQLAH